MPNGEEMLSQLQNLLESDNTIPQNVTNSFILSAVRETYRQVKGINENIEKLSCRVQDVETALNMEKAVEGEREKAIVKYPDLWNDYGKEIVKYLLVAVLTYITMKLAGQ